MTIAPTGQRAAMLSPSRQNKDGKVIFSEVILEHAACDFARDCRQDAIALVDGFLFGYIQLCDRHLGWTGMRPFVAHWVVEL